MKDKVAVTTQLVSAPGDMRVALRRLPHSIALDQPIAVGAMALSSTHLRQGQHTGVSFGRVPYIASYRRMQVARVD